VAAYNNIDSSKTYLVTFRKSQGGITYDSNYGVYLFTVNSINNPGNCEYEEN
jgi:hypothetical protein